MAPHYAKNFHKNIYLLRLKKYFAPQTFHRLDSKLRMTPIEVTAKF